MHPQTFIFSPSPLSARGPEKVISITRMGPIKSPLGFVTKCRLLGGIFIMRAGAAKLADAAPALRTPRSASVSAACPPRFLGPLLLSWKCHLRARDLARDFLHLQEMTRSWVVVSDG